MNSVVAFVVVMLVWTVSDFVFAGVLFGTVGLVIELAVRRSADWAYRGGVAFAAFAGLLIVWANGAVGMIGNEDNGYNLLFGLPVHARSRVSRERR